jgi:multisubunit Na+/H+ antiporter MnhG subunit
MFLVPTMYDLVIAVIIPMPMAFMAVFFVAVTPAIIIVSFVFVAMFIVTAPVSMALLGKNHTGAEREYCYGESMQPSA